MNTTELDSIRFRLNGVDLPDELLRKINEMYRMSAPALPHRVGLLVYLPTGRGALAPTRRQHARSHLAKTRSGHRSLKVYIRDVELEIKYLMGKHFHRGQDADLGPYEYSGI